MAGSGGPPPPRAFLPSFSSLAASLSASTSASAGAPPLPIFLPSTSPLQTPPTPTSTTSFPEFRGERCVGCGSESAIRVHYGAPSCHGCKAFFRRSVFEGRHYACSAENHCEITNESRNRCRACRFRNCLDGGMNPKHVREERSKSDRLHQERQTNEQQTIAQQQQQQQHRTPTSTPVEEQQITIFLIALERQCEQLTDEDATTEQSQLHEIARQVTDNLSLQNIARVRRRPMVWTCERIMSDEDISSTWYRAFVLLADWAMSIPEFRILPQSDQTILFRQNFMTFGWLHYTYKCYANGHSPIGMPIGNGSFIPYRDSDLAKMDPKWISTYGLLGRKAIDTVVKPMAELEIDEEEYCLLKTIALFQPDNTLSETGACIAARQRDKLLEAFATHSIERRFPHLSTTQKAARALKATLLFPALISISQFEASFMQNLSAIEVSSLCGISGDVLRSLDPR
ncbi:unnamed protein product, partial [Mesorhabditis belari]|uniref:Uncharacterized protein n=1 Tax=Mesorhabditis belari TaxID=2138241 RepID=A0AAF3FLM9_9BILA